MTIHFNAIAMKDQELEDRVLGQPSAEPLTGEIICRNAIAFNSDDGKITSGTWECEPGASRWEFLDRGEFIHVISGRMSVQQDGEDEVELTAGASAVFPIGWQGIWTVHEKFRKAFVVYRP